MKLSGGDAIFFRDDAEPVGREGVGEGVMNRLRRRDSKGLIKHPETGTGHIAFDADRYLVV